MYNFDKLTERRGTNSVKWDELPDPQNIPLWVADMDFEVAPAIKEALLRRVEHGIFGYTLVPDSYYESIIDWFSRRHNWQIEREQIIYTTGVVPAISACIRAICRPGDGVVVQTPVYNCFFSCIRNCGCNIVENPLKRVDHNRHTFTYDINYADLEQKCAMPEVTAMVLCNPHNPAGRVWKPKELVKIAEICARHNVRVISDEIHCELVMPGHRFTPFAVVAKDLASLEYVSLNSPSKSFNIAGLQIANIITPFAELRARIDRAINDMEVCDVNPFGVVALQAAYNKSEGWLKALNAYLHANYIYLRGFLAMCLPQCPIAELEGTYLAWVDISKLNLGSSEDAVQYIEQNAHVQFNAGTVYGAPGEGYLRINLACPRARLQEALNRLLPLFRP